MRISIVLMLIFGFSGCASQQQRVIADAYASQQSSLNIARAEAVRSCAQSSDVSGCMLGVGLAFASGSGAGQVPVVQSDLQSWLGLAGQLAPVAGAVLQSGYSRDIALSAQAAQTAQFTSQWSAIGGIVRDTTAAQSSTSAAAFNAMSGVSIAASDNSAASASAYAQTLGLGFATLPQLAPTITAGRDVVQGNDNDLSTDIRRDTLTAGTELRIDSPGPFDITTQYELICTAAPAGNAGNGANGGAGGASSQTCTLVPRGL